MATQEDQLAPRTRQHEQDWTNYILLGMFVAAIVLAYLIDSGVEWFVNFSCSR